MHKPEAAAGRNDDGQLQQMSLPGNMQLQHRARACSCVQVRACVCVRESFTVCLQLRDKCAAGLKHLGNTCIGMTARIMLHADPIHLMNIVAFVAMLQLALVVAYPNLYDLMQRASRVASHHTRSQTLTM
jgi:hypothetical protein